MRLVKGNRIVEDRFVRVLDDAPMPDSVPVIVPAARFLADHAELSVRSAPVLHSRSQRAAASGDFRCINMA